MLFICTSGRETRNGRAIWLSTTIPMSRSRCSPIAELREAALSREDTFASQLSGRAIVFYFQSLADLKYRQILECMHFLHRCQETVLCDSSGRWESIRIVHILRSAPRVLFSIVLDVKTLIFWWFYLQLSPYTV